MKPLTAFLALSSAALGGCATTSELSSEVQEMVRPMRDVHMACMVANAAGLDDGQRDPEDLVGTVEGLCAPLLEPMRAFIAQEGYGEDTADRYVDRVFTENRRAAQDTLVRVRTEARRSP